MVRIYHYGRKQVLMFEPFAFKLSQLLQEDWVYNNSLFPRNHREI